MKLDPEEARRRFTAAPVARLATVGDARERDGSGLVQPHVVPVTFAVDGDRIVTAVDAKPKTSRRLKRLRNIRAYPRVSVLADHYEADWDALWWVRADGGAEILESEPDRARPLRLLADKYPQYGEAVPDGPVIVITVQRWIGWAAA